MATRSANSAAARGTRPAIVFDPVVVAVASIATPLSLSGNGDLMLDGGERRLAARLGASDGIGHVDENVVETEALGEMLAEPSDAESLRGVVAGGDHMHAQLGRGRGDALGGLAGEQR